MPVYGTRPEAIKMAPLISALQRNGKFEVLPAVTGQHREMLDEVNRIFSISPIVDLDVFAQGAALHEVTERILTQLTPVLRSRRPDAIVVQGDTTSAFAAALAAFYEKVPVIHLEAGLRTESIASPFPEEGNRRLITQIAQLHLVPTVSAKRNLLFGGTAEAAIAVVGNTVIDALLATVQLGQPISNERIATQLASGRRTVLVTSHRRESWGAPMTRVAESILRLARLHSNTDFVFPLHANPVVRETFEPVLADQPNVLLTGHLSYTDLCLVLAQSTLVITDSGGLQEEAPALGVPVVVLRDSTERQESVAVGAAILAGTDPDTIVSAAHRLLSDAKSHALMSSAGSPFGDGFAGARAAAAIAAFFGLGTRLPDFEPLQKGTT